MSLLVYFIFAFTIIIIIGLLLFFEMRIPEIKYGGSDSQPEPPPVPRFPNHAKNECILQCCKEVKK
jgi:hypothetical protein